MPTMKIRGSLEHFKGCLLGGAVGDALGAPIEFLSLSEIRRDHGPFGIADYLSVYGRKGAITDDTQMTLFTAEGLLRAHCRFKHKGICHPPSVLHGAYLRWLATQGEKSQAELFESATATARNGWLFTVKKLHARRAPGLTCLGALRGSTMGTIEKPLNDSKGCGGVMRMAPVGLIVETPQLALKMGCECAALTHGHPTGYLAAGCLAAIICGLREGMALESALETSIKLLMKEHDSRECIELLKLARDLAGKENPTPETVEKIGAGWTAGEALAIGVYCALVAGDDFRKGVLLSVNHSGDSDSTGSIAGNILGVMLGHSGVPAAWLEQLELKNVISDLATDLQTGYNDTDLWWSRYPGF